MTTEFTERLTWTDKSISFGSNQRWVWILREPGSSDKEPIRKPHDNRAKQGGGGAVNSGRSVTAART